MTTQHAHSPRRSEEKASALEIDSHAYEGASTDHLETGRVGPKALLAVFTACLVYFAEVVNVVGCGSQTPIITAILGGSASTSIWLSSPLTILAVVLAPMVSQVADYWGRRELLVALTFCGVIGSIIVSRATTMGMAIAGFTLTGVSYGAQPLVIMIASEVLPRRYRSWGQAADLIASSLGGLVALIVGGALSRNDDHQGEGFRYFWYMTAGLYAVATVLAAFLYKPPKTELQTSLSWSTKLAALDWVGYLLLSCGLVSFSVGLSWCSSHDTCSQPRAISTLTIGLVLVVALGIYEWRFKSDGIFHHDLFRNSNFPIALFCVFCEGVSFFAANQYYSYETSVMYESDGLLVNIRYCVSLIVTAFTAFATGFYCAYTRRARWMTVASFVVFVGFFVGMAFAGPSTNALSWAMAPVLGVGLGISLCTLLTVSQLSTPRHMIALTSGLLMSVRSLGGSVGLASFNSLLATQLDKLGTNIAEAVIQRGLSPHNAPSFIKALTTNDASALMKIPGVTPSIIEAGVHAFKETYQHGFSHLWTLAACFAALAGFVAIFIVDIQEEFDMHIDAPMYSENQKDPIH